MSDIERRSQDLALSLLRDLQVAIKEQARLFLVIGNILKQIKEGQLYLHMGQGGYDTWEHFLNNPEVGLRRSTAYLYIRIYEYYIEKLKMKEDEVTAIPINRLMRILPKVKEMSDEQAKEFTQSIGYMTSHDFDAELKDRGMDYSRPLLRTDKNCGRYIFEFDSKDMCHCGGGIAIIDRAIMSDKKIV